MRPTVLFASAQTFEAGTSWQPPYGAAASGRVVPTTRRGWVRSNPVARGRLVYTRIHGPAPRPARTRSPFVSSQRAAEPDVVSVEATDETVALSSSF